MNEPQRSRVSSRRRLITSMVVRSVVSLLVLAVLTLGSFLVLRHQAHVAGQDARLVNLSGRQRMLVCRTAHIAEMLLASPELSATETAAMVDRLRQFMQPLQNTHFAFLHGDQERGVPPPSACIQALFLHAPYFLHDRMTSYLDTLDGIAENIGTPTLDRSAARDQIRAFLGEGETRLAMAATNSPCPHCHDGTLLTTAGLGGNDLLVEIIQRDSEQRLGTLKLTADLLFFAHVIALLATAVAVFRPMVAQVQTETAKLDANRAASENRAHQLEAAVSELELLREEDSMRATAMLNIMSDLSRERGQLQREVDVRERTERQFRSVVEAAPNAMVMIDRSGRIALVNRAAEVIFQYSRDELIGEAIEQLIPDRFWPGDSQSRDQFFQHPRATLIGEGPELRGRRKDGSEFLVEVGLNPIETDEGLYVLSSVVDMTAHQQAHESATKLAAIVESSHDAIIGKTLDGVITSWNRGAENMYGYAREEAVGKHVSFLVPSDRAQELDEILTNVQRGELVDSFETVRLRRDGTSVDIALTASPIADSSNQVVGASIIARDITQKKRAARKLEQYACELERSNRELEQFAYVASHDLKEPLRMVASYTNLLAEEYRGRLDAEADKYIAYASDGAKRMSALIDDLLNYSRVGRVDSPYEETSLSTVVEQVIEDLQTQIVEAKAKVEVVNPLPTVQGNPTRLRQLFQNLVGNALKFRDPQRPPLVRISSQRKQKSWLLQVQDNGIGIDAEYHERIFQVFQRLHTADEYSGTGIGLAVCKKIVEQHGGKIGLESHAGNGTTFHFTLPDYQPAAKNNARDAHLSESHPEPQLCNH